ncbi:Mitochondrial type 2c protein [Mycena sanguinolenta]|uniref:Mitochondrial type 2c protein n=1 Tax=Mycena sanguinolenta TaxID=230812 RepID=A0A8H6YIE3_9AGAR|nr:Mitochondrial type 2c protein [Mycena sanguinolenta]
MEPLQWAYPEDIPGSRCTPEDGPWPRAFYLLDEAEIWEEFQRLADPSSILFNAENGWRADGVNFQPSPMASTQDRYILRQLNIHGRLWALTGVFDGHLGEETVAHVAHHLPIIVEEFLQQYIPENPSEKITPGFISDLFSRSIVAFDDAIAGDILELFGGSDRLDRYSDQEIRDIINDQEKGGDNYQKARLCMYGTTALVALTDPEHENLWIANLGDCQAVLVSPRADTWDVEFLTTEHNTENDAEIERASTLTDGLLVDLIIVIAGALAPTRGLGDVPFKQPPSFTRRILYNLAPGFSDTAPWEICLNRNLTPPYISAKADITHRPIAQLTGTPHRPYYLVLASDGFTELCRASGPERVLTAWAEREAKRPPHVAAEGNLASRLLRQAIGGEDRAGVSCMLTLDMDGPWVDDTAIVVQTL